MPHKDIASFQNWLRKRNQSLIIFTIQSVLLAMDFSVFMLNCWSYLNTSVQNISINTKILYGLIVVSYMISSAILSFFICRYADKHRNVRQIFLLTNTAAAIGNVLYMLHYSPWLLLLGRVIAGGGLSQRSVIMGELARCYSHDELGGKISVVGIAFAVGFMVGPVVNAMFATTSFSVGNLYVSVVNISGVYMTMLFGVATFFCHLFLHDLSKEYDLKAEVEKNTATFKRHVDSCFNVGDDDDDAGDLSARHRASSMRSRTSSLRSSVRSSLKARSSTFDGIKGVENRAYAGDTTPQQPVKSTSKYTILSESAPTHGGTQPIACVDKGARKSAEDITLQPYSTSKPIAIVKPGNFSNTREHAHQVSPAANQDDDEPTLGTEESSTHKSDRTKSPSEATTSPPLSPADGYLVSKEFYMQGLSLSNMLSKMQEPPKHNLKNRITSESNEHPLSKRLDSVSAKDEVRRLAKLADAGAGIEMKTAYVDKSSTAGVHSEKPGDEGPGNQEPGHEGIGEEEIFQSESPISWHDLMLQHYDNPEGEQTLSEDIQSQTDHSVPTNEKESTNVDNDSETKTAKQKSVEETPIQLKDTGIYSNDGEGVVKLQCKHNTPTTKTVTKKTSPHDLPLSLTQNTPTQTETSPTQPPTPFRATQRLLTQLLTNRDTSLLLALTFIESFLVMFSDMVLPIIVLQKLNWGIGALNGIFFGEALAGIVPCFLLIWRPMSDRAVFYYSVASIFAYTVIVLLQIVFTSWSMGYKGLNIALFCVYCFLFSNVMVVKDVFLAGFLAKMVSSRHQSAADSIRLSVCRAGSMIAVVTGPFLLDVVGIVGWIFMLVLVVFGCFLLWRRRTLSRPRLLVY